MSYQVIARRWRPAKFDEVVFQDHISRTIRNSIKSNRIPHSYLFAGPRGVGKTTTARILAKSLNCVNGPTADPCGVCENCVEIAAGTSFDVIEIDGASNNSVDNIRELRENVNFAPVKSKFKIYIIDEVHMLSTGAFNALLKTLEEPPAHVIFIFATTETHKVPDTILSRCQKFYFKKITTEAIANHLKKIVESDGFTVEGNALYPIARAADGSMRDAQSLLEQIISFTDGKITESDVLENLGIVSVSSYFAILTSIGKKDAKSLIDEVERVISSGTDPSRYIAGLLDVIRGMRLVKNEISLKMLDSFSESELGGIKEVTSLFHDEEISAIYRIGSALMFELKSSANERASIEMALLDMLAVKKRPSLAEIMMKLEDAPQVEKKNVAAHREDPKPSHSSPVSVPPSIEKPSGVPSDLKDFWVAFMAQIKVLKQYLFQKLNGAQLEFMSDRIVITQKELSSHINRDLDERDLKYIKDELSKRGGRPVEVVYVASSEEKNEPLPEAEMLKADFSGMEKESPVVETLLDIFHGEIVEKGDE